MVEDNYFKEDSELTEKLSLKRAQADITKVKNYFMRFRLG